MPWILLLLLLVCFAMLFFDRLQFNRLSPAERRERLSKRRSPFPYPRDAQTYLRRRVAPVMAVFAIIGVLIILLVGRSAGGDHRTRDLVLTSAVVVACWGMFGALSRLVYKQLTEDEAEEAQRPGHEGPW